MICRWKLRIQEVIGGSGGSCELRWKLLGSWVEINCVHSFLDLTLAHIIFLVLCIILGSVTSKEMSSLMNTGYACDRYDLFQQQTSCCRLFPMWRRIALCLW